MLRRAKKRKYLANRAEDSKQRNKVATRKARREAESGIDKNYISPEELVKNYREKQKSYAIYRRAVCCSIRL